MGTSAKKILIYIFGLGITVVAGWCGWHAWKISQERATIKADYSTLNNITFGLLSVNAWRDHVTQILDERIENFNFTPAEKDTLRKEITGVLHALVDEAAQMIDKKPKKFSAKLKRLAVKTFVKEDDVHKKVPEFANTIVNEILKKKSRTRLKYLAQNKLKEAGSATYDSANDIKTLQAILKKYDSPDVPTFNKRTEGIRNEMQHTIYSYTYYIIGLLVVVLLVWWLCRSSRDLHTPLFIVSVTLAMAALLTGLVTPMIEIDARIKELSFTLIGEKIVFNDQVIFYQSKSIVDVVHVLIKTGKFDSIAVGVLILVFSILFPIGKLAATQIYLLGSERTRNRGALQYFAFKSGKWSMADVTVVAIFMAYIGFKGILDSQLEVMNVKTESLASVSTNETSLQPGFILFVAFVLFSLILFRDTSPHIAAKRRKTKGLAMLR